MKLQTVIKQKIDKILILISNDCKQNYNSHIESIGFEKTY